MIHTNCSVSNSTILNKKDSNESSNLVVMKWNKLNFRLNSQCNRRLTWSPKIADSIRESLPLKRDIVHPRWKWQKMVNSYKCSISVITETQFVIQTPVTQQPNCTERLNVDAIIINTFFQKQIFSHFLVEVCRAHWPGSGQALVMHGKMGMMFN